MKISGQKYKANLYRCILTAFMFYGRIVMFLLEFLEPLPLSKSIKECLDDVKLKA